VSLASGAPGVGARRPAIEGRNETANSYRENALPANSSPEVTLKCGPFKGRGVSQTSNLKPYIKIRLSLIGYVCRFLSNLPRSAHGLLFFIQPARGPEVPPALPTITRRPWEV
jgi:hypothetical protein